MSGHLHLHHSMEFVISGLCTCTLYIMALVPQYTIRSNTQELHNLKKSQKTYLVSLIRIF